MGGRRWTRLGWIGWGWAERRCNSRSNQRRVRLVLPSTPEKMPSDPIHQTTFRWVQSIGVEWVEPTEKLTIIEMGFCSWIRLGLIQIIEIDKLESGLQRNADSKMLKNYVKTFRKMRRQVVVDVDVISRDLGRPVWRHPILVTRLLVAPSLPNKMGIFLYISSSVTH